MSRILELLALEPARESIDYVESRQQFHLHSLVTEQRHPATWNLGFTCRSDIAAGLRAILSVDEDIARTIAGLTRNPAVLEQAVRAVVDAVRGGRRIYIYGCGATGRLAKQMESAFWRPFWRELERSDCWKRLEGRLPANIAELLAGEMTGADRALVSSLEGFEDLMLLGELQLRDHGISRGDVVFCVTEGGETSSVIGTILAALGQYGDGDLDDERCAEARRRLYFVYNNPDEVLRPFDRSRRVLEHPAITRLCLATGPQAVAGSTRMQATTIETFVIGVILEEAIFRLLREHLSPRQLAELGFRGDPGVAARLRTFDRVKAAADRATGELAKLTELEAATYERGGFATYFARRAMVAVFTDCTERSPTFRLFPLDRVGAAQRRSWVQVWTEGDGARNAWRNFLGRPFHGLDPAYYRAPLAEGVKDPYLKKAALSSLKEAGNDQESLYDFSFSGKNVQSRGPRPGDAGVLVLVGEELDELGRPGSAIARFRSLFGERGAQLAVVGVSVGERGASASRERSPLAGRDEDSLLRVSVALDDDTGDPLTLRQQIALKMLLNAHSTAVMARLGRVVGNTMTNVSPSNLKLIGRATFLVLSHVNDALKNARRGEKHGDSEPITFAEANAVVFDAMSWVASRGEGQTAEVALSIVRILESLRRGAPVSWKEAQEILEQEELAAFLLRCNPALDAR
jgi:N-acetylmuramic acid 6-phosphate (MurNAc-6-P) etherase